jgi:hypothetical protein
MKYENHLYAIIYPKSALVASHYLPEQFAEHYISGSSRYYEGKLVFLELDTTFRNPWFDIEKGFKELIPHTDGRPKATRFISCYRILEHISFEAMKNLYLTTPDGACLELRQTQHELPDECSHIRIYSEIDPLGMMVLSRESYFDFGKYITDPENPKSAPQVCYTQLHFDAESFLSDFSSNPLIPSSIPGVHPAKLRNAINDLQKRTWKRTKGLNLENLLYKIPWSLIRHGFMFASQDDYRFYKMPDTDEIEIQNLRFWRNM